MDDPFDLSGKLALVTGGSRGLGFEMARAFAAHGADVVVASRKKEACEEAAQRIADETGRTALGVACHVGKWDEVTRLGETVWERFGRVDVLVNNAGMSPPYATLGEVSESLYDKVLDVNLKGPFRLSVLLGERMKAAGGGAILNVSSTAAVAPSPVEVPYAAAKAGLNNLTVALAVSFAPEVRVNAIMPGPFRTDISKAWGEEGLAALERQVPLGRAGEPGEIVGAALYLASPASAYTTGSVLKVDGGMTRAVGGG